MAVSVLLHKENSGGTLAVLHRKEEAHHKQDANGQSDDAGQAKEGQSAGQKIGRSGDHRAGNGVGQLGGHRSEERRVGKECRL